jgi:hypothetical protein
MLKRLVVEGEQVLTVAVLGVAAELIAQSISQLLGIHHIHMQ